MRGNDQEDNCGEESQGRVENSFVCYLGTINSIRNINKLINQNYQLINHLLDQLINQ